jgi:transketolase
VIGGLFSAISEAAALNTPVPMESVGIADHFGEVGKLQFLKEKYRLTAADIAAAAEKVVGRKA